MKHKYVHRDSDNTRLLLIYAGWAMDWRPFANLHPEGYDVLVVWDYRSLTFNWKPLLRYNEICLMAWSMGVLAASITIHEIASRITKRIAVNGTLTPVDDRKGIPVEIFRGTLQGLTPANLRKFMRRMCGSREQYEAFCLVKPRRTFEDVRQELEALETHAVFHVQQVTQWDLAVVSRHDSIFPPSNMLRAWHGLAPIQQMEAPHLPDFAHLASRLFINKDLVSRRFSLARDSYQEHAVVQRHIARHLMDLAVKCRAFPAENVVGNIIEAGVGRGMLTDLYLPRHNGGAVHLWDIAGIPEELGKASAEVRPLVCDAETQMRRTPSESAYYILSASTIQWFNSPASFLRQCARVLAPGGSLIISTFAHGNMAELAPLLGTGLPLPTPEAWRSMIPENMEVMAVQAEKVPLRLPGPRAVLEHLRHTGVNSVGYGRNPAVLARRILENFPVDADGQCTLTYRPVYMIARKTD